MGGSVDLTNPNPNYLTIVALEDGLTASLSVNDVEYSIDGNDNWTTLTAGTASPSINTGQTLSFRGNLTPASSTGVGTFTISKSCDLTGNCNSLLFGDDTKSNLSLNGKSYAFYKLFYNCSTIKSVSSNFLPATTLANYCYSNMFYGCYYLTSAPDLPATELASYCYQSMFQNCTISLTKSPELPATELASYCYQSMFQNCPLKTAPKLPATVLKLGCYYCMFQDCIQLTKAPELPAKTLASSCYVYMFNRCQKLNYIKAMFTTTPSSSYTAQWVSGVASSGTFVKNKNATWNVTGIDGIPSGWTVVSYDPDAFIPKQCLSLSIEAVDISGKETSTTVYYTATVKGLDDGGNTITKTITGTDTVEVGQNTSTTNSVTKTVSYTYMGVTATTTITQDPFLDSTYTVNLNSQWQTSSKSNPDSTMYDIYESYSNKGTGNSGASMYINIDGYSTFKFYIRSYAESNYDYVMVSQLDKTLTYSSSYSDTTLVKAHTRGNQKSGTTINDYTLVEFTNIDGGSHRIQIIYRKDGSANSGDDRGYVLIPKNQ